MVLLVKLLHKITESDNNIQIIEMVLLAILRMGCLLCITIVLLNKGPNITQLKDSEQLTLVSFWSNYILILHALHGH